MSVSYDDDETRLLALCMVLINWLENEDQRKMVTGWLERRFGEDQRQWADEHYKPEMLRLAAIRAKRS